MKMKTILGAALVIAAGTASASYWGDEWWVEDTNVVEENVPAFVYTDDLATAEENGFFGQYDIEYSEWRINNEMNGYWK